MSEEVKRLFELPTREILKEIFAEAKRDDIITPDEEALLNGIKEDLDAYESTLVKAGDDQVYTQAEIKELEDALKNILLNSLTRAQQDRKVTKDEEAIILALVRKIEDILVDRLKLLTDQETQ